MPDQQLTHALQGAARVESAADHGLNPRQSPPLIRPAVRDRALSQLRLQLGELALTQPRWRGRTRRPKRADRPGPKSATARPAEC